jgi:uncharacterized protein YegL
MKTGYTHIVLLIDRSGSMESIKSDMEGGLKTFLEEQKKEVGDCTITAAQFDTYYDLLYSMTDIRQIQEIKIEPRGATALLDSMYRLIQQAGKELDTLPEESKPSKVLFVTITDGEENSSREITNRQLNKLIRQQEDVYSWDFVYVGANQDAFAVGQKLGVKANSNLDFIASEDGVKNMYSDLSKATSRFRNSFERFGFTDEEQAKAKKGRKDKK